MSVVEFLFGDSWKEDPFYGYENHIAVQRSQAPDTMDCNTVHYLQVGRVLEVRKVEQVH